ncbi:hypothetical protein J4Q44_G00022080 [Coregonus suidteri]|uniref:FXYD domain-containing ion transport regulator n=1 Tax=Coregonus suidteri TaxID=861788 RepID=A0AAN8M9A4_9TELE
MDLHARHFLIFSPYTHLHLVLTRVGGEREFEDGKYLCFAFIDISCVPCVRRGAERKYLEEEDPFTFDYHRLRVGGLILAAVLCLIGITILFSGHCRCKFNQDKRRRSGSNAQPLNDQGLFP